ncbi:MAG: hypothetical protein ACO3YQ_00535 [Flavobacteriales bacterium]
MNSRFAFLATALVLSTAATAQDIRIGEGKNVAIPLPTYLEVVADSDPLGLTPLLETELKRVGYRIVSPGERAELVRRGATLRAIAAALPTRGARKAHVKDLVRENDLRWRKGGKEAVAELVDAGVWKRRGRSYRHVPGASLAAVDLSAPYSTCRLTFSYDDRVSITCSRTVSRLEGTFEDLSGGNRNVLFPVVLDQGLLANTCPPELLEALANRLRPTETAGGPERFVFESGRRESTVDGAWAVTTPVGKGCSKRDARGFVGDLAEAVSYSGPLRPADEVDRELSERSRELKGNLLFTPTPPALPGFSAELVVVTQLGCTRGGTDLDVRAILTATGEVIWSLDAAGLSREAVLNRLRNELAGR